MNQSIAQWYASQGFSFDPVPDWNKIQKEKEIIDFFLSQGLSIIPIKKGLKESAIPWKRNQLERASPEQVYRWWFRDQHDLAVVCGAVSGNLVVIDFDDPNLYFKTFGKGTEQSTLVVMTSCVTKRLDNNKRKRHVFFKTRYQIETRRINNNKDEHVIDIQGEGAYVKIPPSLRDIDSGLNYDAERLTPIKKWDTRNFDLELDRLLRDRVGIKPRTKEVRVKELFEGIKEGGRHDRLIRLTSWLKKCETEEDIALEKVRDWNLKNDPPLPDEEVEYQFASVWKLEEGYNFRFDQKPRKMYSVEEEREASRILREMDPFTYVVDTAHLVHSGDDKLIKLEYTSAIGSWIEGRKINTWAIGPSGSGKTHLKETILTMLPENLYEVFTSSSPLSLFYYVKRFGEGALDKTLIFLDEVEASRDTLPMLRSLTGQTEITPRHLSVFEGEVLDMRIKGQRAVWFTSVRTIGTEQIQNRFINTTPDESLEQDLAVFSLQDRTMREGLRVDRTSMRVVGAMTEEIIRETADLKVKIPYKIRWSLVRNRRLYPIFLSTIKVVAKVRFRHRKVEGGVLEALPEDFETAKKMWMASETATVFRIAGRDLQVLEAIPLDRFEAKTHAELAEELMMSTSTIGRACQELSDRGLISSAKREREGPGRHAWEFWRTAQDSVMFAEIGEGGPYFLSGKPTYEKKHEKPIEFLDEGGL